VDRTFGTNGIARTDRYTSQLLVQPDGKIVLGTAYLLSPKVYRYTASGQLDTSFGGGDGKTVIQDEQADIQGLALDSAGRIVTAGGVIARLTPEGLLDATFGTQGVAKAGGEVVVDNQLAVTAFGGLQFVRVDENGNPDSAFGTVTVNLGTGQANRTLADPAIDQPQTLLVRPDGSVLVGRRFGDGRFVQVRIDDAGSDPGPITVSNTGALNISGTDSADRIFMDLGNLFSDFANVTLNGIGKVLHTSQLTEIIASGNGGNDDIGTMALSLARRVTLIGGDGDDTLRGSYGGDSISGDAGNDSIDGANGADILSGGDGDDTILGGDQSDQISGNDGRDRLLGGRGHDRIFGGASGDRLYGQGGDDQLNGEGGNDRIYGDDFGGDTLRGGAGDDLLVSRDGAGDDQLFGDGGRDTSIADAADLLTSIEVLS